MSSQNEDFFESYRRIHAKLKKKNLLRRPNFGEGIEELSLLINSLKRLNPNHLYIAFFELAVARCEQALNNNTMEASFLSDAGYIFWLNSIETEDYKVLGFQEELCESIKCYLLAIDIYRSQKKVSLASSLYYEMAIVLKHLDQTDKAAGYFIQSANLYQIDSPMNAINSLNHAVDCHIKLRDYKSSCTAIVWIMKLASEANGLSSNEIEINGSGLETGTSLSASSNSSTTTNIASFPVFSKILMESRVSLILLLILESDFQQAKAFIKKLIEDSNESDVDLDDSLLITLLETLVHACDEQKDNDSVKQVQRLLYNHLNAQQNALMLLIVEQSLFHKKLTQL